MKKAIAAILTDTHLKESNIDVNISVFKQARQIGRDLGLNKLLHAGDIFESRKGQSQKVLNAFKRILDETEEYGMDIIAIPGNHDKTDYTLCDSFLDPFATHPAFQLIRIGDEIRITKDIAIWMIPFFNDNEYINAVSIVDGNPHTCKYNVLLTHIGMNGAVMNNGIKIESGINAGLFQRYDKVLIGHYHDYQHYSDKIIYIGSSIQHNFGETPDKGLTVLYDDLSIETIELQFPRFLKFEVDVKDMSLKDVQDFEEEKKRTGNNYKIILTGDEAKIKAYDKSYLQEAGITVGTKQEVIVAEEIEERVEAYTVDNLFKAFDRFCEKDELIDKEKGLKYLNKAFNVHTEEAEAE